MEFGTQPAGRHKVPEHGSERRSQEMADQIEEMMLIGKKIEREKRKRKKEKEEKRRGKEGRKKRKEK